MQIILLKSASKFCYNSLEGYQVTRAVIACSVFTPFKSHITHCAGRLVQTTYNPTNDFTQAAFKLVTFVKLQGYIQ